MKKMALLTTVFCSLFVLNFVFIALSATYDIDVHKAQIKLKNLGYNDVGKIDGLWGNNTKTAVKQFQRNKGLSVTGELDSATRDKLDFGSVAITPELKNNMKSYIENLREMEKQNNCPVTYGYKEWLPYSPEADEYVYELSFQPLAGMNELCWKNIEKYVDEENTKSSTGNPSIKGDGWYLNRCSFFAQADSGPTIMFYFSKGNLSDNSVESCKNQKTKPYNSKPSYCAPENTRGKGVTININGTYKAIPDLRCGCLPIALRYNNPGVLKTPSKGPWPGQIDKDTRGHAVFESVEKGIEAWVLWIKKRFDSGSNLTAFEIMSIYAPPDDCVGSIGTPPDCPYGINPTEEYAERVAKAVGKGPHDYLNIDGTDCLEGRKALYSIFLEVATFEIGSDFCKGQCKIDEEIFNRAVDNAWGPVQLGRCSDPPEAHSEGQ